MASIVDLPEFSKPYMSLKSIQTGKALTAKLEMDVNRDKVPERKTLTVKHRQDLFDLSNERDFRRGYIIQNIDAVQQKVEFTNGVELRVGEQIGVERGRRHAHPDSRDSA